MKTGLLIVIAVVIGAIWFLIQFPDAAKKIFGGR